MDLNDFYACLMDRLRVYGRVNVCLDNADTVFVFERVDRAHKGRGLSGTRGGHQIHEEDFFLFHEISNFGGDSVVVSCYS